MLPLKCYTDVPNVGDGFNRALAEWRLGRPVLVAGEAPLHEPNLVLGGSILHWADRHSVVCGAGLLFAGLRVSTPAHVSSVRGPLTAASLRASGISCPDTYGDPAILAPLLFPAASPPARPLGIVPHYVDLESPWVHRCRELGLAVVDVRLPLAAFLEQLQSCDVLLSSSLHGVVFAHAYNRRALWIELSDLVHGAGFKFLDYYASIGVDRGDVVRQRVGAASDPWALARLATEGDHAPLRSGVEAALEEAVRMLTTVDRPRDPIVPAPSG